MHHPLDRCSSPPARLPRSAGPALSCFVFPPLFQPAGTHRFSLAARVNVCPLFMLSPRWQRHLTLPTPAAAARLSRCNPLPPSEEFIARLTGGAPLISLTARLAPPGPGGLCWSHTASASLQNGLPLRTAHPTCHSRPPPVICPRLRHPIASLCPFHARTPRSCGARAPPYRLPPCTRHPHPPPPLLALAVGGAGAACHFRPPCLTCPDSPTSPT